MPRRRAPDLCFASAESARSSHHECRPRRGEGGSTVAASGSSRRCFRCWSRCAGGAGSDASAEPAAGDRRFCLEPCVGPAARADRAYYPKPRRGRQPLGVEKMLRIDLLQQWFNLSGPQAQDASYDSEAMRRFVRVEPEGRRPRRDDDPALPATLKFSFSRRCAPMTVAKPRWTIAPQTLRKARVKRAPCLQEARRHPSHPLHAGGARRSSRS
jgi:hypothetical protein